MHLERIGPYQIMGVLGRGGLGVVYRAVDERTSEEVAVKLLLGAETDNNKRSIQRFLREFHALAELDHPHVIRVIEAGLTKGMPFFSMELVEGLDIKRHVDLFSKHLSDREDSFDSDYYSEDSVILSSRSKPSPILEGENGFSCAGQAGLGVSRVTNYAENSGSGSIESKAFDVNDWLGEADSDVLLGRQISSTSGVIGAIGPAPSIDLPFEVVAHEREPFEMPPVNEASEYSEYNDPIRISRVRELIVQVSQALVYVHSRGLVHRDLKPSNILVDIDGEARLMDFGLCKAVADIADVTDSGQVVGTYRYMSPEQACGEPLDARSDLYSLGVVIYELLAGRPPFLARSPMQLWEELLESEPPSLLQLNPGVDPRLAQVVHCLLRKDPASRLQTAEEVLEAILE